MITKLEPCYYAKCSETGEVWECSDFKTLYRCLRFAFRTEVGQSKYYTRCSAVLHRGVYLEERYADGSLHGRYVSYDALAFMCATCVDSVSRFYFEDWRTF